MRQNGRWVEVSAGGTLAEAPRDGRPYARQDATWVRVEAPTLGPDESGGISQGSGDFAVIANNVTLTNADFPTSYPADAAGEAGVYGAVIAPTVVRSRLLQPSDYDISAHGEVTASLVAHSWAQPGSSLHLFMSGSMQFVTGPAATPLSDTFSFSIGIDPPTLTGQGGGGAIGPFRLVLAVPTTVALRVSVTSFTLGATNITPPGSLMPPFSLTLSFNYSGFVFYRRFTLES